MGNLRLAILGLVHLHLRLSILGSRVLWLVHLAVKLIVHYWLHRLLLVLLGLHYRWLLLIVWGHLVQRLLRLVLQLDSSVSMYLDSRRLTYSFLVFTASTVATETQKPNLGATFDARLGRLLHLNSFIFYIKQG